MIITLSAMVWLLFSSMNLPPQAPTREYQVKAVFLYNFTQFVEWPSTAFPEANTPFVIGILGKDPFGTYLDETVQGEKVNEHPLVVQRFDNVTDIKLCHILFISVSEKNQLRDILEILRSQKQNILTVGDAPNFAKQGGIVRFFTEENKTRIRINLEAAREADLTISSKLLRVAEIFDPQNN
jgi:hypothetical protein